MIRGLLLSALLAGCQEKPRTAEFFASHPPELAEIVAECSAGRASSAECSNARAAQSMIEREERMEFYRRGFR